MGAVMPAKQTAAIFLILSSGMISRWRAWMYLQYRALTVGPGGQPEVPSQEASA